MRIVRHERGIFGKVQKFTPDNGKMRRTLHHFIGDMVDGNGRTRNDTPGVYQTLITGDAAVFFHPESRQFHNAVIDRTAPGGLQVENRERSEFMPDQLAYRSDPGGHLLRQWP